MSLRAPGSAIDTQFPTYVGTGYRKGSGTSMATGAVSGVVALMLQPTRRSRRTVSSRRWVSTACAEASADPMVVGAGLVDAYAASFSAPAGTANQGLDRSTRERATRPASTSSTSALGGSYRYVMGGASAEYGFRGCFHDVRPGELIIQTFTFEGFPDGVALEKLVFEDLGDGRSRLVATSLCDSFEGRDAFLANGMEEGVRDGYQRLDQVLAQG